MQRRTLLKASLTAAAALSLPLSVRGAFAAEPFTFYGLKSMSGAFASYGKFADMVHAWPWRSTPSSSGAH